MKYWMCMLLGMLAAMWVPNVAEAGRHGWGHGGQGGHGGGHYRHPQDDHIKIEIGSDVPYYYGGRQCDRPVYYAPQPVYYYPQPVYYAPPPRPVYYYSPGGVTFTYRSR